MKDAFGNEITIGDELIVVKAAGGYSGISLCKAKVTRFGKGKIEEKLAYTSIERDGSWYSEMYDKSDNRKWAAGKTVEHWTFPHRVAVIKHLNSGD